MKRLLLALALPVFGATVLPLDVRGPYVIAEISLSGQGPLRFLLDTGAQSSVVDPELARTLQLHASYGVQVAATVGEAVAPAFKSPLLCLGNHCVGGMEILAYPLDRVRAAAGPIDGVLGQSFLSHFNFLLDYSGRTIYIEDTTGPQLSLSGARVPFTLLNGRPSIRASLSGMDRTLRLVLDSAASHVTLFGSGTNLIAPATVEARLDSSFASDTVNMLRVPSLRIEDQLLHHVPTAWLPGRDENRLEDGLLPVTLFRAVYFNPEEGYVVLNPGWEPES